MEFWGFFVIYGLSIISVDYCQLFKENITVIAGTNVALICNKTEFAWRRSKNGSYLAFPRHSQEFTKYVIVESSGGNYLKILNISYDDEDEYCCYGLPPNECTYVHVEEAPEINISTTEDNVVCVVICNRTSFALRLEHFSFSGTLLRSKNASCENNTEISLDADNSYQTDGIYRCKIYSEFLASYINELTLINKQEAAKHSSKAKCFNTTATQQENDDDVKFYLYGYNALYDLIVYENGRPIIDFQTKNSSMKLVLYGEEVDVNVTVIHVTKKGPNETKSLQNLTLKFGDNTACTISYTLDQQTENILQITDVIEIYILSCCGGVVFVWILTVICTKVKCKVRK